MLTPEHLAAAQAVATLLSLAAKSVNEVLRDYENTLTRFCFEVLRGGDAVDFRRSHKALIRTVALEAYVEGLREGGVSQDEMDDEDAATVKAWIDEQVSHVNDFAAWLASGDPRNSEDKRRQPAQVIQRLHPPGDPVGHLPPPRQPGRARASQRAKKPDGDVEGG
jgi:hypothetical protein